MMSSSKGMFCLHDAEFVLNKIFTEGHWQNCEFFEIKSFAVVIDDMLIFQIAYRGVGRGVVDR